LAYELCANCYSGKVIKIERESALGLLSRFAFAAMMRLTRLKAMEKVVKRASAVDFV
jgi:hypothetical protein